MKEAENILHVSFSKIINPEFNFHLTMLLSIFLFLSNGIDKPKQINEPN